MSTFSTILSLVRPKTLLLGAASVLTGYSSVANEFSELPILILCILTATSLQILSNIANDYGDFVKGTDNENRLGPKRSLQTGKLSLNQFRIILVFMSCFSLAIGIATLLVSDISVEAFLIMLGIGILSILAAIGYTMGKVSYGYRGLGDVAVFIFFGLICVNITAYLSQNTITIQTLLNAMLIGALAVAVLNLNNMRDFENDKLHGKNTLVVYLGRKNAFFYHNILVYSSIILVILISSLNFSLKGPIAFLPLISILPLSIHLINIYKEQTPSMFDSQLKIVAISTFLYSLLFTITIAV